MNNALDNETADSLAHCESSSPDGATTRKVEDPIRLPPGAREAIERVSHTRDLTPREQNLLELVCSGKRNEQIAQHLKIANPTVRFHLRNIHRKSGTCDKLDIVLLLWADAMESERAKSTSQMY